MDPSPTSPSHSSNSTMQYHHPHQRLPSHLFHEHSPHHFTQDAGPPLPGADVHPSIPPPRRLEMQSRIKSHPGQQEMYSSLHPPSHEGNYPAYPLPENGEGRFPSPYQHQSPLHDHQPHPSQFVHQYNTGTPLIPENRMRQDSFPRPMSGPMPVPSPMQMLAPQHRIPTLPDMGHHRLATGETFPMQPGNLPLFHTPPPPAHLLLPSTHHTVPSHHNVPNHTVVSSPYMGNGITQTLQTHENTPPPSNASRPHPPSQHIPHLSNRNTANMGTNSPSSFRNIRTFSNATKQGLDHFNGSSPRKVQENAQQQHQGQGQGQRQGYHGQVHHHQRNVSHSQQSQSQNHKQHQQKTPKQKRFYNTQQGQHYHHYYNHHNPAIAEGSSSPFFKYIYNRRSSIISNTSGNSTLIHATPQIAKRHSSSYYTPNLGFTEDDGNQFNNHNSTFVKEEEVWNGDLYPSVGLQQQRGIGDNHSGTTWNTSETMLYPYSVPAGVEQPCLIYQPCMNLSCPNIYHYTQQIYQPISEAHPAGPMTLVDIPGILQAPAWCELSACGCTICRDCFTHIIAKREMVPSSHIGSDMYETTIKKFNCEVCSMECREFGPVNEAVQNVVECSNAIVYTQRVSGIEQTSPDMSGCYDMVDQVAEIKYLDIGENNRNLSDSNLIIPTTNFDDFQSAQDVASGKLKASISTTSNETLSTTISPLRKPISASNEAKSDPPLSIPHSPLVLPVAGNKSQQNIMEEKEKLSDSTASIDFPSLLKDVIQVTLPSRKTSSTSTNTASTTNTYDSPVPESTPDLGAWSSSSASINSMPSSPETLHSPTMALRSLDVKSSNTPWKQKAPPFHYEAIMAAGTAQEPKSRESIENEEIGRQHAEKSFLMPGKLDQIQSQSIGLGLKFGTAQSPISRTTTNTNAGASATKSWDENKEKQSISHTPVRERTIIPSKKGKNKGKAKNLANASPNESIPTPTPQKLRPTNIDISSSPTTMSPYRNYRPEGPVTPSRPSRGHSRLRGGGAYIVAHQARMAEISQHNQTPHKPVRSDSFGPTRNRTDTQSSIHTSHSSSSNSAGSWQPHGRKVSMAENRLPKLPELLANPCQEQISIWKDNKAKWWIDPWLGHLMGLQERLMGGERIMVRSDGSRLVDGRAAGISWPILKVHNIAFTTTITDIESFVPDCTLAPLAYNAQAVHLLCDLSDGKTRPYAYVECISAEAAETVIRESDGKYLAGRQVGIRPVTQKELALDLFSRLRRNSYCRDRIFGNSPYKPEHQKQYSGPFISHETPSNLDLFNNWDYKQLNRLFDKTLPLDSHGEENNAEDSERNNFFFFPPEKPFARLISMIVKYPYHAMSESDKKAERCNQEIDRFIGCVLYAMEKLAPHIDKQPALRKIWDRLHTAVIMCPAFDGPRRDILTSAWERHLQVLHLQY